MLRSALNECATFRVIDADVLDRVFDCMEERRFRPEELLIRQGDVGDCLFLVVEGNARAQVHNPDGRMHPVGEFQRGMLVGEMALLTQEPRTADVVALTDMLTLALPAEDFDRLAGRCPELAVVLTELLAERLGRGERDGLGGKTLGGFRIRKRLGRGGMSVVYEAEEVASGERVALKMMSHALLYRSGARSRFRQEAELIGKLDHDRIARLRGQFSAYKTHFLAMDLIEGPTLTEVVRRHGALPEEEAKRLLGQIAEALAYVHSQGVVHRDLKPGNVLLGSDGWIKLTDFGLAKPGQMLSDATATLHETMMGTPSYMAPEQLSGLPTGPGTDIYALGSVAYELLTGRRLFRGTDLMSLIEERITLSLPPAEELAGGISVELHSLMERALQRKPEERGVSLEEVAAWSARVDPALAQSG